MRYARYTVTFRWPAMGAGPGPVSHTSIFEGRAVTTGALTTFFPLHAFVESSYNGLP